MSDDLTEIECALLWKLARTHGWSSEVRVKDLVSDAAVLDEREAREVAKNQLAERSFIRYHPGRDEIAIVGPPPEGLFYHLRDECGYSEIQIKATFSSYFDGF
ncbi:MAG: hypothetical protein ABEI52_13015 [Halobacteriaceae archaeon]